jgi:glycosyltransferase involved in cell wall biosynthesis
MVSAKPPPFEPCIIYNGVSSLVREPAGRPRDAAVRRVLFAGRFEAQKGTDILCAALPLVQLPAGVKGELTLIGHGAQQSLVDALAERPPSGWTIAVQAPVSRLDDILPQFDLVVMPSRFEGLGLVAIEATLAGLPVVATDAPGLREALPADYPWRAAPGDAPAFARALTAVCDASAGWSEIVRAAQQFAQARFSPARMSVGYRQLYERTALLGYG